MRPISKDALLRTRALPHCARWRSAGSAVVGSGLRSSTSSTREANLASSSVANLSAASIFASFTSVSGSSLRALRTRSRDWSSVYFSGTHTVRSQSVSATRIAIRYDAPDRSTRLRSTSSTAGGKPTGSRMYISRIAFAASALFDPKFVASVRSKSVRIFPCHAYRSGSTQFEEGLDEHLFVGRGLGGGGASAAHQVKNRRPHAGRDALNLAQRHHDAVLHGGHRFLRARYRLVDHHFGVRQLVVRPRGGVLQHPVDARQLQPRHIQNVAGLRRNLLDLLTAHIDRGGGTLDQRFHFQQHGFHRGNHTLDMLLGGSRRFVDAEEHARLNAKRDRGDAGENGHDDDQLIFHLSLEI